MGIRGDSSVFVQLSRWEIWGIFQGGVKSMQV